ncbi:MAG: tetratricopeptide repeat protein [Lachnospiraceae bacterium]|nr:tetratricopeptide repeat protein [Lachnospiraceae bacterium]
MKVTEIFQVLGIEETKDEAAIKNAYRAKLAATNPEDNPEGFKRLRTAYEEACAYAKEADEAVEEEEDLTPSGQWVKKVAVLYGRLDTRQDVNAWRALLEEDIFLSLEEEENCHRKLLGFLMENFRLPTEIWKLLDEKLNIAENGAELKEYFPGDFVNYMVTRCKQGEDLDFGKFEGEPDADYDLFIHYSNNCWEAISNEQLEQAKEFINNADDLDIYHPVMELNRAWLWEKQGKETEAIAWLEKLWEKDTEDLMIGYHYAEMLWKHENFEEAAKVFEAIKGINEKHYMANSRLTQWYYDQGRYQDAKDCAEKILSVGVDDDFRELLTKVNQELEKDMEKAFLESADFEQGLELGWCYLQDGRYSKGITLVLKLGNDIPEEKKSEYRGLLAKLYVEGAEYEKAIEMAALWEEALLEVLDTDLEEQERTKNEDRWKQSHSIRSYCYRQLGYKDAEYFKKAIEHIECVETKDKSNIGLMMEKAKLYLDMDELDKCLEVTRVLLEDYQVYAAFATQQEAYRKMWDAEGVLQNGYNCIHFFPDYVRPYERIAKVYLDLQYTEDFEKLLADAKEQQVESIYLDAFAYRMTHEVPDEETFDRKLEEFHKEYQDKLDDGELEYYEKGLPLITEYFYWCPGAYMLVERALFHKAAGEYDSAIADCEKALVDEPGNPYAWNVLAYCYKMKGDYEQALISGRNAILYFDKEYPRSFSDLGDYYSLMGNHNMALENYREVVRIGGEKICESRYYMRRYAFVLARNGLLEEAEKVINRAYDDEFERYSELVELYYDAGADEKAQTALRMWEKLLNKQKRKITKSQQAKFYEGKAWTELVFGEGNRALDYFEQAVKLREAAGDDIDGICCDTTFACALCGDDVRGRKYAAWLREFLKKEQEKPGNPYHEMDKIKLEREFISQYYTADAQELEAILAKEDSVHTCYFCTYCLCKELEGMRILQMLRMGKTEEAFARVESNLKKQPLDEFMLAIKNVCKKGVPVVPYAVNGCSEK